MLKKGGKPVKEPQGTSKGPRANVIYPGAQVPRHPLTISVSQTSLLPLERAENYFSTTRCIVTELALGGRSREPKEGEGGWWGERKKHRHLKSSSGFSIRQPSIR